MDRILGISDRTSAALHALALAASRGGTIASNEAAAILRISPSYLGKVLQSLAKAGVLASSRGARGGFSLRGDAAEISCMDILVLLDGELPQRSCLFPKVVCDASRSCPFARLCAETARRLRSALEATSIADLAARFASET
jgi:Rrf2 family protein